MIRKARINDINEILDLLTQVLNLHHKIRPDIFKADKTKYTHDELVDKINKEPIFVYEEDGHVVGHIFLDIREIKESNTVYEYKYLYIDDLVVDKKHQNEGIGYELYSYAKRYAKSLGIKKIILNAWEGNDAVNFYKHLGLKIESYHFEDDIDG